MKENVSGRIIWASFAPGQPGMLYFQVRCGDGITNVRVTVNDDDQSPTVDGEAVAVADLLSFLRDYECNGSFTSEGGEPFYGGEFTRVKP